MGTMTTDELIDWLHAIMCQFDGNTVTLDGQEMPIEDVCEFAIEHIASQKD